MKMLARRAVPVLAVFLTAVCVGCVVAATADGDFGAVRAELQSKTALPFYYPDPGVLHRAIALPPSTTIWSVLKRASPAGYAISFSKVRGCYTSTPCVYGSLAVNRVEQKTVYGPTQSVALANGVTGTYQPPNDANVSDGVVTWKRDGVFFSLELVEGRTPAIADVASSVIGRGPWK